MTVPHDEPPHKPLPALSSLDRTTAVPAAVIHACAGGPPRDCCPTCGRPYVLFWLPGSQLLDLVETAKLALTDLQAAIEEEVLP